MEERRNSHCFVDSMRFDDSGLVSKSFERALLELVVVVRSEVASLDFDLDTGEEEDDTNRTLSEKKKKSKLLVAADFE